jgi:dihydrofolate synthase/folylpolyglutamate synthase
MKLRTVADAVAELQKYIPQVATYSGDDLTLNRMWPLLQKVGNPQKNLKVIHVAGTSGKTSTSYFISSILVASGKKIGLTVSPHIDSITERIQINNIPLGEDVFCKDLGIFLDLVGEISPKPSYFEILVAFIYWEFNRQGVDYAVIETGMGGLLDGTNVVMRTDKVCVITDIGYDHMHILGDTLPEIASQKAGIIQDDNNVFMYEKSSEIMNEIKKRSIQKNAKLNVYHYDNLLAKNKLSISRLPDFQKRNLLLSQQVCRFVASRDSLELNKEYNPEKVTVPARMETIKLNKDSVLIMDGAHNSQKMRTFVDSFRAKYPTEKAAIMLALKRGKEYREAIDEISPIARSIVITTFSTSQDLPAVSQDPYKIKVYCDLKKLESIVIKDHRQASEYLINQKSKIKIITGSFYLIGQVREYLK